MVKEKQEHYKPDPRTWLLFFLAGITSIIYIHSELGVICVLLFCVFIHLYIGKIGRAFSLLVYYIFFTGLAWLGVKLVEQNVIFSVSSMLSNIGIVGRKVIIPLAFACCLAEEPTGSLMAAIQALRFPKAVGIAVAVVLRFLPTISMEYRAIRSSQRFRGIGVGVVHTLTHLPSTVEYILIPLILRTTKVAEELSAAMTVRGVRFSAETRSYRTIRFTGKDVALCAMALLIPATVFLLERRGIF